MVHVVPRIAVRRPGEEDTSRNHGTYPIDLMTILSSEEGSMGFETVPSTAERSGKKTPSILSRNDGSGEFRKVDDNSAPAKTSEHKDRGTARKVAVSLFAGEFDSETVTGRPQRYQESIGIDSLRFF